MRTAPLASLACAALLAATTPAHAAPAPAHARAAAKPVAAAALPADTPAAEAPKLLSDVPADLSPAAFAAKLSGDVKVRVHVDADGLVDSVRAVSGDARLRPGAEAAARWYVFEAAPNGAWLTLTVHVAGSDDDPLQPDPLREAVAAERAGDLPTALAWWTGALRRVGTHATLRNAWALREQTLRIARRSAKPPEVALATLRAGRGISAQLERTVARGVHLDLITNLQPVLLEAPWWDDPYRCLAASCAGSGDLVGARRALKFARMAANDTKAVTRAEAALHLLAKRDTLQACELLKKLPLRPENTDD